MMVSTISPNELRVPEVSWSYPLKRSPHYQQDKRTEREDWFLSHQMVPPAREQQFRQMDFTYLCAVAWPRTPCEVFDPLVDFVTIMTVRDDSWYDVPPERGAALVAKELDSLESGFTAGASLWEPLFADAWRRFATHVPSRQLDRLAESVAAYLRGSRDVLARWHALSDSTLEDYLVVRCQEIGQNVDRVLSEISTGVHLPAEVLRHPAVERLHNADTVRTVFIQDLLSLTKELKANHWKNAVLRVAAHYPGTPQQAVDIVHAKYIDAMQEFDNALEEVQTAQLPDQQQVLHYLAALRDFAAGLIAWTGNSPRYQIP